MRDMIVDRYLERNARKEGGKEGRMVGRKVSLDKKGRVLGRNDLKISIR